MKKYSFESKIWKYNGKGGWFFISLPTTLSKKIRNSHGSSEEGWGRLKSDAQINKTRWATAIWYDSRKRTYVLPIKLNIRKKESLNEGDKVKVAIFIEPNKNLYIPFLGKVSE